MITPTIGLILMGVMVLAVIVSGAVLLFAKTGTHNPNAKHYCPCCGEPEETHTCNSC
jgi:hypothetical protein